VVNHKEIKRQMGGYFMSDNLSKLDVIASKKVPEWDHLYKIIDFLNKNLKDKNIIIGLSKKKFEKEMIVTIYETM
jgi:hypothetical protein